MVEHSLIFDTVDPNVANNDIILDQDTASLYFHFSYYHNCYRRSPLPLMTPSPPPTPPSSPELPVTLPRWYELIMYSLSMSEILIQCYSNETESHARDVIWMGTYPTVSCDVFVLVPHANWCCTISLCIHRLT